jgi:hypothetical protein
MQGGEPTHQGAAHGRDGGVALGFSNCRVELNQLRDRALANAFLRHGWHCRDNGHQQGRQQEQCGDVMENLLGEL